MSATNRAGRLLLPGLLFCGTARAGTLTVTPGDPGDYDTIGDALAAASPGSTIVVAAGTYDECLVGAGVDVTIQGAGADSTVIDGSGLCTHTVELGGGEQWTLTDLTLTNLGGRGVYLHGGSIGQLTSVDLVDSGDGGIDGAGVYVDGATLRMIGGTVRDNLAREGGGVFATNSAVIEIDGATFQDNQTTASGGALDIQWYATLDVRNTVIADNIAAWSGGGVLLYVAGDTTFDNVEVRGNQSAGYGGGIEIEWYARTQVVDSIITGNSAVYDGGGLGYWYQGHLTVEGTEISGNSSGASGGGLFYYPGDSDSYDLVLHDSRITDNVAAANGGGVYVGWARTVSVQDTTLWRNTAGEGSSGGGMLVYVAADTQLIRNDFCGNTAGYGGGVSVQWSTLDSWRNNIFSWNQATYGGGAHRYVDYDSQTSHNSFLGNRASGWGGAYFGSWAYSPLDHDLVADTVEGTAVYADDINTYANSPLTWSAWSDNEPVHGGGYFYVDLEQGGNIEVDDPGLMAWDEAKSCDTVNLRLALGSPLRDAGNPDGAPDLDGSVADIGAYGGPDAPVEDWDGDGHDTTADCVDTNAGIHPDADELCDGWDQDCDGDVDEDAIDAGSWYQDDDGDGFGGTVVVTGCSQPDGTVETGGDCDDDDPDSFPGATDIADDGIDQDCDGADTTTADTGSADTGQAGDGGDEQTPDDEEADAGCGCGGGGLVGWAWLLVLPALRRRRS